MAQLPYTAGSASRKAAEFFYCFNAETITIAIILYYNFNCIN